MTKNTRIEFEEWYKTIANIPVNTDMDSFSKSIMFTAWQAALIFKKEPQDDDDTKEALKEDLYTYMEIVKDMNEEMENMHIHFQREQILFQIDCLKRARADQQMKGGMFT